MTDCLEVCKVALERGLISKDDFNSVKSAFVKAQQLKAGLDAGLVQPSDYQQVRDAFIQSVVSGLTHSAATPGGEARSNGSLAPSITRSTAPATVAAAPISSAPELREPAITPPVVAGTNAAPSPAAAPSSQPATPSGGNTVPIPSNIPDFGGKLAKPQGTSISGINVSKDAINLYYLIKAKAQYRWAMWKIDPAGQQVVIAAVGSKTCAFKDFVTELPANDCRYAVYDYQYVNSEGIAYNKIVFLNWAPDTANIRSKMMYASTKDFFRGYLDGLSVEFQASELDEISEDDVHQSVRALVVRK